MSRHKADVAADWPSAMYRGRDVERPWSLVNAVRRALLYSERDAKHRADR